MKTKTIVLIHGMFMTPLCWEKWIPYYESKGFRVLAPAWPGREKSVEELRAAHPDPELAKLKLNHVVDHMETFIKGLDEKPAIIGHSMGGLAVQILLQRDVAVAGIAIDPAPPAGVFTTEWSFIKANFPAINPFLLSQPVQMTFERFQYAFVNTLPLDEQRAAYDRYVVPESRGVPTSSLGAAGKVDFSKLRRPLLITAGEKDHIIPASLNSSNYQKYKGPSVTDFKEFAGRDHFLIGSRGWEEIADYSLAWLGKDRIEPKMSKLVPMTQAEFEAFLERTIPEYAADHVRAGNWTEEESLERSRKEFESLLPQGLKTADNFLYSLVDGNEAVGLVWIKVKTHPSKSGFIYDVFVEERFRGKGYGRSLMLLLEEKAYEMELKSLELHVFGSNHVARKLYETIGYETTNVLMSKKL